MERKVFGQRFIDIDYSASHGSNELSFDLKRFDSGFDEAALLKRAWAARSVAAPASFCASLELIHWADALHPLRISTIHSIELAEGKRKNLHA